MISKPALAAGLAYSRTPMEVINIATAGTGKGLFFPMGGLPPTCLILATPAV